MSLAGAALPLLLMVAAPSRAALTPRPASQIPDSSFMMDLSSLDEDGKNTTFNAAVVATLAQAGMKWARVRPNWPTVEKTAGVYISSGVDNMVNNCRSNGVSMLMLLETNTSQPLYAGGAAPTNVNGAMTPWLDYVDYTVRRYKDSVAAWEIWNEANLNGYPLNAAGYANLVVQTAQKIRSIVPNAYLIANVSFVDIPYLQAILPTAGQYLSAVSIHPYRKYPEQPQDAFALLDPKVALNGAANYEAEIAQLRAALTASGFPGLDIWDTETGYPIQSEGGGAWNGSPILQQKNMARHYMLNLGLGIKHSSWFPTYDTQALVHNVYTPPTSAFIDDHRNTTLVFNTMAPLFYPDGVSIGWPATTRTSDANITVAAGTVTAGGAFPTAFTSHTIPVPVTGDYQIWVRIGSTAAGTPGTVVCEVNGSQTVTISGDDYYYAGTNAIGAILQGSADHTNFYWSPCGRSPSGSGVPINDPPRWALTGGSNVTVKLYPFATTRYSEIRLLPIGSMTEKPSMTTLRTLTAIFDDRVGLAPSLGVTFSQGTLSAPEFAAGRSFKYSTRGGVPVVVYWTGIAPVDAFAEKTVGISLSAKISDAIVVDPLTGTYASVGEGTTFSVRAQDYPLILTSLSALDKSASQLLLAEETYNYPNPARGDATYLRFYLTQPAETTVEVYNSAHAKVYSTTVSAAAGKTALPWSVGGVGNGVYLMKVTAGGQSVTKKILILK